ncbi:hypothetical protein IFM47457_03826 [Aspergillus lentulus]|nr:hypothetical protein IFM47457_03826 [Aspergillus lentulus]
MATMRPIVVCAHHAGPNPKKTTRISGDEASCLLMPMRGLILTAGFLQLKIPNTGITLWESGAILEYLVTKYDEKSEISFPPNSPKSGQGPYFGQAVWFRIHHKEQLQTAVERYVNEIRRVSGVLNGVLADRKYLVNDKCSYADIVVPWVAGDATDLEKDFPNVYAWLNRLKSRPSFITGLGAESEAPKKL